jgi:NADH-quinone oxidoreductase subunit M
VSHLGFCVIGAFALNTQGIQGSIFTMLSHGLTTSGLFLAIGVLYERRHTRKLSEFGGLWAKMPVFAGLFLIITLGSVGLPGLSGFVGEFLSLIGSYTAGLALGKPYVPFPAAATAVATTGVILGAVYLLYMFQKLMFGPLGPKNQGMRDLTARETVVFVPVVLGIFVLGIYPKPFLRSMEASVTKLTGHYEAKLREPTTELHFMGGVPPQRTAGEQRPPLRAPASPDRRIVVPPPQPGDPAPQPPARPEAPAPAREGQP